MKKLLLITWAALLIASCTRIDDVPPRFPTVTPTATWSASQRDEQNKHGDATPRPPQSGHDKPWITPTGPTATMYSYP